MKIIQLLLLLNLSTSILSFKCMFCFDWEEKFFCGEDGNTYDSYCKMKCAKVTKKAKGKCKKSCDCSREFNPVCGVDGRTYPNYCQAQCDGIEVRCKGMCKQEQSACGCSQKVDPICGDNGITYQNSCQCQCKNIKIKYQGKCVNNYYQQNIYPVHQNSYNTIDHYHAPQIENYQLNQVHTPYGMKSNLNYSQIQSIPQNRPHIHRRHVHPQVIQRAPQRIIQRAPQQIIQRAPKQIIQRAPQQIIQHNQNYVVQKKRYFAPNRCNCPQVIQPVCGSDGIRYENSCQAQCKKVTIIFGNQC